LPAQLTVFFREGNLVIAGAVVLGGTVRGGRLTPEPVTDAAIRGRRERTFG
jgi:hypothetical protein